MTKRFTKFFSILLTLAFLLSWMGTAFAEDEMLSEISSMETGRKTSGGDETLPDEVTVTDVDFPESNPETDETEETPSDEPEKTEITSEGITLEEAAEQPVKPAEEDKPAAHAADTSEKEDKKEEEKKEPSPSTEPKPESKPESEPEPESQPETGSETEPEEEEGILLNLNSKKSVTGILTRETQFSLKASDDYSRIVTFTLTVPAENTVSVILDDNPITLSKSENEDPADTDITYTFEYPLLQGEEYSIILQAEQDGYIPFTLKIEKKPDEIQEEETAENPEESTEEAEKAEETDSGLKNEKDDAISPNNEHAAENIEEFPDDFAIHFNVRWDTEEPHFGDIMHFYVTTEGDDNLDYYIIWQWSTDNENWNTVENENGKEMDLIVTEENYLYYWRIKARLNNSIQE